MPETEIQIQLEAIQQKLKRLLDKHSVLIKETATLRLEKDNLHEQIKAKDEQIKQLQQQNDILKSGIQTWHPEQKKIFVKRIDLYLKEIEKCLAIINE